MDPVVNPIDTVSVIAIIIMIGSLVIAYVKKWMVTYALIIANVIVFILTIIFTYDNGSFSIIIRDLGFRPIYLTPEYSPQLYTLFTSMFIHGGFAHIFGNMFIFLFLGIAFEQRIGAKKFLIIYLISGICGTLTHSLMNLGSEILLIGASGAIFGIMGAFAFSYPRDEVVMPVPIIITVITKIKVMYAVILFAVIETIIVMWDVKDTTAHYAHLGGLISGVVLAAVLLRKQKKHDKKGATVFYDSYSEQQPKRIDFSNLEKLANTPDLKEILDKVEKETVSQVQEIWLGHFLEKIRCQNVIIP